MVKKKNITSADIDKLAFEINSIGKGELKKGGKKFPFVAPPTDNTETYKKHKAIAEATIKVHQENIIKKLKEDLERVQKKIQEPLKPIIKLQEKINKDIKPITEAQKKLKNTTAPFNPFFNFMAHNYTGGGLLGTGRPRRRTQQTLLGGYIPPKTKPRNKPDKEKRDPDAIGIGINSYMKKHKLVNPVEFAKVYPKNKDYKINGFIVLRELCAEMNVNVEEALLYICEGMTSNDTRWRKHRIEKEFWRGSVSVANIVRYYKDQNLKVQSKGASKYSVKDLWKSKYVKNIFVQNSAKVPSYPVFSQWFKKHKHHCEVLELC